MENLEIKITASNRNVTISNLQLANQLENLQGNLVFKFTDNFIDGVGRLEYRIRNKQYYVQLEKDEEEYYIPIKNVLTNDNGYLLMQLCITQLGNLVLTQDTHYLEGKEYYDSDRNLLTDYEIGDAIVGEVYELDIPLFKSNIFEMYVNSSINAVTVAPSGYSQWIDVANEKIVEINNAIDETSNLDLDVSKSGHTATITLTDKEGVQKEVEINDGIEKEIIGGTNIEVEEDENTITINNTYDDTTKQDTLVSGTNIKTINGYSVLGSGNIEIQGGGSSDFEELTNRPSYNGTTMSSSTDIPEVPTNTSDLTNDSGFITNIDYATQDSGGVVKLTSSYGTEFANDKKLRATIVEYANYNGLHNNAFIGKRTLENVITGKGIVKNTDYATQDNAGVIKISNGYGSELASDKKIRATIVDYSNYGSLHNNSFIGKRTLENVIAGKELVNQTQLDTKQNATDTQLDTTDKTIVGGINEVNSLVKQSNLAKSYTNYQSLINELNSEERTKYKAGQSFLIQTLNVPDLWVFRVEYLSTTYTYTTDEAFITATGQSGGVQVGYYRLCQLETLKQDLTNYVKNNDYAQALKAGAIKSANDYQFWVDNNGLPTALVRTYQQYNLIDDKSFVSKGTLDNVLANTIPNNIVVGSSNNYTIWNGTQAQYDAITTKDDNTIYLIVG